MSDSSDTGNRRLINATAIMASGTLVSRVLGFVRAIMIAIVLGNATRRVEVFTFAQMVPSYLYLLLAGGTLNSVLVPQIVKAVQRDADGGKAFIDRIITAAVVVLGVLTALLTLGVPLVMRLYVSSWQSTPELAGHWQSLVLMSYVTMPQLFFYGMFVLIGQVLNARNRFGPMMWAPIANNVVSIAMLGSYLAVWGANAAGSAGDSFTAGQVWWLGVGSTLGIVIQSLILLPYLRKAGVRYRPRFDFRGTGLGATFRAASWVLAGTVMAWATGLVVSQLASRAASGTSDSIGGINAYSQAQIIWILPHSLLTVSLATAMLPVASRLASAGDAAGVAAETTRAMRLATTLTVPAAFAFLLLADPLTKLIFGHGSGAGDYHVVTWVLMAFALGLVPYSLQFLMSRGFYAFSDTRTPFFLQIVISAVNAGLAIGLYFLLAKPATVATWLAVAYSAAYVVGVFVTFRTLRKRLPTLSGQTLVGHLVRLTLAALPAVGLAWLIVWLLSRWDNLAALIGSVGLAGVVALVVFFALAKRFRVPEAAELAGLLRHPLAGLLRTVRAGTPFKRFLGRTPRPQPHIEPATMSDDTSTLFEELLLMGEESPDEPEAATWDGRGQTLTDGRGQVGPDQVVPGGRGQVGPGQARADGRGQADQAGPDQARADGRDENPDPDGRGVFVPVVPAEWTPSGGVAGPSLALTAGSASRGMTAPVVDASPDIPPVPSSDIPSVPSSDAPSVPSSDASPVPSLDAPSGPSSDAPSVPSPGSPLTPTEPLVYPEPSSAPDDPDARVLGGRYRLDELLAQRGTTQTWLAADQMLGRPVLIHLLALGDPQAERVLASARRAGAATDSRLLRVLDVIPATGGHGAYLVHEYAPGETLASLLASGPLSPDEAGWLVREVADAVAGLHVIGLCHGHLNPATVLVLSSGNVKLTNLLVDVALDDGPGGEAADVTALGQLLHACLTGTWAGAGAFGLPGAPRRDGALVPANVVRPGVPAEFAAIVDRVVSDPSGAPRIGTASAVAAALAAVHSSTNVAPSLRRRVQAAPLSLIVPPMAALPPLTSLVSAREPDRDLPESGASRGPAPGEPLLSGAARQPAPGEPLRSGAGWRPGGKLLAAPDATPVPPPVRPVRRWPIVPLAVCLVATVAFGVIVSVALTIDRPAPVPVATGTPTPTPSASATAEAPSAPPSSAPPASGSAVPVRGVVTFDPVRDGGDGSEYASRAARAIDGDPSTSWTTETYRNKPNLGGLKPGVGLVLDLGVATSVTSVELMLVGEGTSVELRVPKGDTASMFTADDWTVVAQAADAGQAVTLTPAAPVSAQRLLVYLTSLPKSGSGYRGAVAEVTVRGVA